VTPTQHALLASRFKADGMAASSPQKLVVLIYEQLSRDLDAAVVAIEDRQVEAAHKALVNAQDLVFELQLALDPELWPGAVELHAIYDYLLGLLVSANLKKSAATVQRGIEIVAPLRESWNEAYQTIQRGGALAGAGSGPVTAS
jgi:flagellar protein FliS